MSPTTDSSNFTLQSLSQLPDSTTNASYRRGAGRVTKDTVCNIQVSGVTPGEAASTKSQSRTMLFVGVARKLGRVDLPR